LVGSVVTVGALHALVTTKLPESAPEVGLSAKSDADVAALTVNGVVPAGVAAVVLIVRVEVFEVSAATNETGFGTKDAVAPVGSTVVTVNVAVKAPEEPGPDPLFTDIV
jgi:hypothetical protein